MSYAKRKDGQGWWAVNGPEDCQENETWQADQPEIPKAPDIGPVTLTAPIDRLRVFLTENPDIAALLK